MGDICDHFLVQHIKRKMCVPYKERRSLETVIFDPTNTSTGKSYSLQQRYGPCFYHLIKNDVKLVVHARERVGKDGQSLSRRTRLVRVEEQHYNVCAFGKPLYNTLEVITTGCIGSSAAADDVTRNFHLEGR